MHLLRRIKIGFSNMSLNDFKKTKFTKLSNRSLLILNGPDCQKYLMLLVRLLQGIMTCDIKEIKQILIQEQKFQKIALYTIFLQQKGKVITDAFVFRPRLYSEGKPQYASEQYWIDIPREAKSTLKQHIKKHMWRKRVEMHDVDEGEEDYKPSVYSGYNEASQVLGLAQGGSVELEEMQTGEDGTYANLLFFDPRGKHFGLRIISMQPQLSVEGHFEHFPQNQHELLFQQLGQVPLEYIKNKLPFSFNYDLMNAISLKKGCYLGQEIVSRGLRAGIIRRRCFPFILQNSQQAIPEDTIIIINDQAIGKVLFSNAGQGMALINYLPLLEKEVQWPLKFTFPLSGTLLNPFEDKLQKYYTEMKGKQKIMQDLQL